MLNRQRFWFLIFNSIFKLYISELNLLSITHTDYIFLVRNSNFTLRMLQIGIKVLGLF